MRSKPPKTYEELIRGYYSSGAESHAGAATVEDVYAGYYGPRKARRRAGRQSSPAVVLSLRCDDGETLVQHRRPGRAPGPSLPGSRPALSAGASLPSVRPSEAAGDVDPAREVQVDLSSPRPAAGQPAAGAPPPAPQGLAPPPARDPAPATPPPAVMPPAEPAPRRAGASDDEFEADLKAILSGKKVFDPVSGKTVDKSGAAAAHPAPNQPGTPQPAGDGTAIFDRIAQSLQYANSFDLGSVELQNRFADFDRMDDLQRRSRQTRPPARAPGVPRAALGPASPPPPKPDSREFLEDLDAIRTGQAEPLSLAEQTSLNQHYADALYDTGEHVLAAETMYPDKFLLGKAPGVRFSYGQIIALADMFASVEQLRNTDATELRKLKTLVEKSTAYYKAGRQGANPGDEDWDRDTAGRYLQLAEDNYDHFAPNILFPNAARGSHGNHKSAWEKHHKQALEQAAADPRMAEAGYLPEWPLAINAFGDHFLTDAFAAGHIVNKEFVLKLFKTLFYNSGALTDEAKEFFGKVADRAFTGELARRFSNLETVERKGGVWRPNINSASRFKALLIGIAEKEPDRIGNLAIKMIHDKLNRDGVEVTNDAGSGTWRLSGDGGLTADTLRVMRQAVEQSIANVLDPAIRTGTINFSTYYAKVWRYVPKFTTASEASVKDLVRSYTDPASQAMVDAAAELLGREATVNTLIAQLKKRGVLKEA